MKRGEEGTGILCLVCKEGEIMERFHFEAIMQGSPGVYGPGGRRFSRYADKATVDGWHCGLCGISYYQLPIKELKTGN
ncbi:MAG: hypothetical protein V1851_03375 [Patescibacteria group bacterium]